MRRGGQGEALAVWGAWLLVGTAGLAAYGAVNATQDLWQEQLVKRGTVDWAIPSALYPGLKPVTLITLLLAGLVAWLLIREQSLATRGQAILRT